MSAGVGFDLDHTLLFDNKLERVAFMRLLEMVLRDGGHTIGNLFEEIGHIDALLVTQRQGAFPIDEAVRRFVVERGVDPEDRYVDAFRTMAVDMVEAFVTPFPHTRDVFATLRERGYELAVLSNGWNPLQIRKAQRCGFDGPVVASADVGEQKPSPRTFEALLQTLNTPPENTWYIGDDPHGDIAGAVSAGLHAVWINTEDKTYPSDVAPPPYTIRSLEQLLALLPDLERVS
jgi:HAD superfamily hydrolase (TIGR01509 family)